MQAKDGNIKFYLGHLENEALENNDVFIFNIINLEKKPRTAENSLWLGRQEKNKIKNHLFSVIKTLQVYRDFSRDTKAENER